MTTLSHAQLLHVRVPATCANLGPGFDVLGLAVGLYNTFTLSVADVTTVTTDINVNMPTGESNLFYRSFAHLHSALGKKAPPLSVRVRLGIPTGRGLGSSATAVVGGLVAANRLLGDPVQMPELLKHAVEMEHGRHADNVAPALLGGLVVNTLDGEDVISVRVPFPDDLRPVLFIPDFEMDTVHGRSLMPAIYSRDDAVFNTSRVALFLTALAQHQYSLLRVAMQDRLHQPYRSRLFPAMPDLINAALEAGACGASLSGGGSSVLALADTEPEAVGEAMRQAALRCGLTGRVEIPPVDTSGAQAWREPA